jgi:serine/threonine protein kinase
MPLSVIFSTNTSEVAGPASPLTRSRGGFSVVKLATNKKEERDVAIKVVRKRKMTKEALEKEVTIWQLALDHSDSVVNLYSVRARFSFAYLLQIYEDKHEVFLVMEMHAFCSPLLISAGWLVANCLIELLSSTTTLRSTPPLS